MVKTTDIIGVFLIGFALVLLFGEGTIPDILPPVDPPPIDAPGLNVLVLYESERITPQQNAVLSSSLWRSVVEDNDGDYHIADVDDDITTSSPKWGPPFNEHKAEVGDPVVIVSDGKRGAVETLPSSPEQMVELVSRYAG